MTDQMQTLRDDIAYMKSLAVAGRQGQILGGSILLLTGLIFSAASVVSWAIQADYLPAIAGGYGLEWAVAVALQLILLAILVPTVTRRARARGGNAASRLFGVVWSTVGMGIFAAIASIVVAEWRMADVHVMFAIAPTILVLYAVGWNIAGAVSGQGWMRLVAAGSAVAAFVAGLFAMQPEMYLVFGLAIFLFMALPGLKLIRRPAVQA